MSADLARNARIAVVVLVVLIVGGVTWFVRSGGTSGVAVGTPSPAQASLLPPAAQFPAPNFTGIDAWINSPPLTVQSLRGKVVLVDFWTFSCVNCVRTIPHLRALENTYGSKGLVIVGVHSPEFDFEKDAGNVRAAVANLGVTWPVAVDSEMKTWAAYQNAYWPAEYVVDRNGTVEYISTGEGDYDQTAAAVAQLLGTESVVVKPSGPGATLSPGPDTTPELYLGSERGQLDDGEAYGAKGAAVTYPDRQPGGADLPLITGSWVDHGQYLQAVSAAHVRLSFHATYVYVVAGSASGSALPVTVTVDGKPVPGNQSGDALKGSSFSVSHQDLLFLLSGIDPGHHVIDLAVPAGFEIFTFTFG